MSGSAIVLAAGGVVMMTLSFGLFVQNLVGALRGTSSGNLEYGIMPAIAAMLGLPAIANATGWPEWPFWMYFVVPVVLATGCCAALIGASKRGRARNQRL